ncbi:hypothetical protein BJX70DRAFT_389803 [Aspergillus crustosus]
MTGIVFALGDDRVVKKPRQSQMSDADSAAYMNEISQASHDNEVRVFQRLANGCKGVIHCYQLFKYGIELARAQDNLENYFETHPEGNDTLKITWIRSLIETFAYIHSRRVFVDDIALRNILIMNDKELKVADFGQAIILPLDADIPSVKEQDLTAAIEMLHLGWAFYSIARWQVHKYYFFEIENPDLRWPTPFPSVEGVLCGELIENCWRGGHASMDDVQRDAAQLLGSN